MGQAPKGPTGLLVALLGGLLQVALLGGLPQVGDQVGPLLLLPQAREHLVGTWLVGHQGQDRPGLMPLTTHGGPNGMENNFDT